MPKNEGFYQKYRVERTDGRTITGPTFTLEIDHDPFAVAALTAYADAAEAAGGYELLVADLRELVEEYS